MTFERRDDYNPSEVTPTAEAWGQLFTNINEKIRNWTEKSDEDLDRGGYSYYFFETMVHCLTVLQAQCLEIKQTSKYFNTPDGEGKLLREGFFEVCTAAENFEAKWDSDMELYRDLVDFDIEASSTGSSLTALAGFKEKYGADPAVVCNKRFAEIAVLLGQSQDAAVGIPGIWMPLNVRNIEKHWSRPTEKPSEAVGEPVEPYAAVETGKKPPLIDKMDRLTEFQKRYGRLPMEDPGD